MLIIDIIEEAAIRTTTSEIGLASVDFVANHLLLIQLVNLFAFLGRLGLRLGNMKFR